MADHPTRNSPFDARQFPEPRDPRAPALVREFIARFITPSKSTRPVPEGHHAYALKHAVEHYGDWLIERDGHYLDGGHVYVGEALMRAEMVAAGYDPVDPFEHPNHHYRIKLKPELLRWKRERDKARRAKARAERPSVCHSTRRRRR